MIENAIHTKITSQDARDFGSIDAYLDLSIDFLREMLNPKSCYYVNDEFTRRIIAMRLGGLKNAYHLSKLVFNRLSKPIEL